MAMNGLEEHHQDNGTAESSPSSSPARMSSSMVSQIPVAKFTKRPSSDSMIPSPVKWKVKFEESEVKRKNLISQFQKAEREREDYQKKNDQLLDENLDVMKQLEERDKELTLLRKLAKEMFKEYDQLKNRYDLDTGALNQAIQRASKWYKQNRELKRKSTALVNKVMQVAPDAVLELDDETDSTTEDETESLRVTIASLNSEIARLQAELGAAKLQEFEAQEQAIELQSALEDEKNARITLQQQVDELKSTKESLGQVTRLVAQEVSTLREQCLREKESAQRHKTDAEEAKRERNILAHQSQLLLDDAASDEKLMKALLDIESLNRSLEEERQRHAAEIQAFQEKLECREADEDTEMLEEKVKLLERELETAIQRAERAENRNQQLGEKVSQLEEAAERRVPPPPPLPPGGKLPASYTNVSPSATLNSTLAVRDGSGSSPVVEVANLLGLKRSAKPTLQQGAIDEIINEIKGGRFTLKTPEKQKEKVEEQPPVVKEMMSVLGTLRRKRANGGGRTPSFRSKTELSASTTDIAI